jgi:hypothetical protein
VADPLILIERHNSTDTAQKRVLVKVEEYPSGPLRVVVKEVQLEGSPIIVAGRPLRLKRDPCEQERVESSRYRTRKVIRQRCMSMRADHMMTLTYRENMQDRDRCYRHTVEFIARCRRLRLLPQYVAVPELQERGAWHVHLAYRGFVWANTLRRIWRQVVGEFEGKTGGNVNLRYFRGPRNPWRIAAYMSKYIGKSIEQSRPGQRTFWASEWTQGAPIIDAELMPVGVSLTQVLAALHRFIESRDSVTHSDVWIPPKSVGPPTLAIVCAA